MGALVVSCTGLSATGRVLRAGLAVGLGLGLCSSWTFLCGLAFDIGLVTVVLGDAVLVAVLLTIWALVPRRPTSSIECVSNECGHGRALVLLSVFVVLAVAVCIAIITRHPHGDGDAMAIWNMRAHYLHSAWGEWNTVFFPLGLQHVDYPLLVPMLVVRGWVYAGSTTPLAPIAIGVIYTFATVAVLLGALAASRGRFAGCVAACALLGTPLFLQHGVEQTADVPMAFFVLSTLVFAVFAARRGMTGGLALGIGCAAGCAAWTKNEGMVFAALIVAALAIATVRPRNLWPWSVLAAGTALPVLALAWFKIVLAPSNNDLVADQSFGDIVERGTSFARYREVAASFLEHAVWMAEGVWVQCGFAMLALYALMIGRDRKVAFPAIPALVLVGMAAIYFMIFVAITPYELTWHLPTTVHRLLLQLWPGTLFVVFAALRVPGRPAGV